MRSTEASETAEIVAAQAALKHAQASFDIAHEASRRAGAGLLDPLTEAEDNHWVRVEMTKRREKEAQVAWTRGRARRARHLRWRALLGLQPPPARLDAQETDLEALEKKNAERDARDA